ncbi:MAG: Rieske 2Fe-2S domain-containing protein [Thermoplasmata archaeon]
MLIPPADPLSPPGMNCGECPRERARWYFLSRELGPYPVGVARRVAPVDPFDPDSEDEEPVDQTRRNLLKLAVITGALAAGGVGGAALLRYVEAPPSGEGSYPKVQLFYDDGTPVLASAYPYGPTSTEVIVFNYPLTNEPNMLLNLAAAAPNGVGPNGSIVAYSAICQHQLCQPPSVSYYPAGSCGSFYGGAAFIHCTCHGSTYDPATAAPGGGAAVVTGPTLLPLPQVLLEWDSGTDYLYALRVIGPPVLGHTNTLRGGVPVTPPVELQPPIAPNQICPS